jgi:hypothetical protein
MPKKKWEKIVRDIFEQEGYTLDENELDDQIADLEVVKEFQGLIDIGPPDKVPQSPSHIVMPIHHSLRTHTYHTMLA